jgi:myo-inositol-1(or 4)-monophosphatase
VPDAIDPVYLATAVEAVIRAGETQLAGFGSDIHVGKKGAIDLVTDMDLSIERAFRAMIAERFPSHAVLGEEYGESAADEARAHYCWVLDPIDGTTNYAHGLPIFCASLALEIDGVAVVGAIYDPTRRELFTAEKGHGAWLNGSPLRVSTSATLIDSLLVTGFHYDIHRDSAELIGLFGDFISRARAVRRLGSAALDLCYVAAGRFDGFWEHKLQAWDVAAGALIVAEAGGRVTTIDGNVFASRSGSVLATNGHVHAEMLETIAGFSTRFRSRNRTE